LFVYPNGVSKVYVHRSQRLSTGADSPKKPKNTPIQNLQV
jgi:hypothetical protein